MADGVFDSCEEEEYVRRNLGLIAQCPEKHGVIFGEVSSSLCALGGACVRETLASVGGTDPAESGEVPGAGPVELRPLPLHPSDAEQPGARALERWSAARRLGEAASALTAGESWGGERLGESLKLAAQGLHVGDGAISNICTLQVEALSRYRADPSALDAQSLQRLRDVPAFFAEACSLETQRRYVSSAWGAATEAYEGGVARSLRALAAGGTAAGWVSRFAWGVEVERRIDALHPGPSWEAAFETRFAAAFATTWLSRSLGLLPWIIAWLLAPSALGADRGLASLAALRQSIDASNDPHAMQSLLEALAEAVVLLASQPASSASIPWIARVLATAHAACRELLPDVPAALVSASLTPQLVALFRGRPEPSACLPPAWASLDLSILAPEIVPESPRGLPEGAERALALALHEELRRQCWEGAGAWQSLAPLLLLLHLSPDPASSLSWHALLAALRALSWPSLPQRTAQLTEKRLLRLLRRECGASHLLHHLGELQKDALGRGLLASDASSGDAWRAVVVSEVAASSLGLRGLSSASLADAPPLFRASQPMLAQRALWDEDYRRRFAHRKLRWQPSLGTALIRWRHLQGETMLLTSEAQAHALLAFNASAELREAELLGAACAWEGPAEAERWSRALAALAEGPLERLPEARLGVRLAATAWLCTQPWPDLAAPGPSPEACDSAARAPAIDAAVVRLLKRWRVLTAGELQAKLSEPAPAPESAELWGRVQRLAERGLLRIEASRRGPEFDPSTRLIYEP